MSKKKKTQNPSKVSNIIKFLWLAFAAGIVGFVLFIWAVSANFLGLFGEMPEFESLENPQTVLASELYASDGYVLCSYARDFRSPLTYDELSHILVNALIATGVVRFVSHSGIDDRGMARVLFKSILLRQSNS